MRLERNTDLEHWTEWKKRVKHPESMFVGWSTLNGKELVLTSLADTPPSYDKVLEAVWYCRADSYEQAMERWRERNGILKGEMERTIKIVELGQK